MIAMILLFGCAAALAAGASAYLIALNELQHHFRSRRPARIEALRQALVAAGFFLALGGVLAVFVPSMVTVH